MHNTAHPEPVEGLFQKGHPHHTLFQLLMYICIYHTHSYNVKTKLDIYKQYVVNRQLKAIRTETKKEDPITGPFHF